MGRHTSIEYCDSTVNELMGCTGCELYHPDPSLNHCYAATLCRRWASSPHYPVEFSVPQLFPGRIAQAIAWPDLTGKPRPAKPWLSRMPRVIFLNDLGDTFCIADPNDARHPRFWLLPQIPAMAASPHIWLFLTKRPMAMLAFFERLDHIPENFWLGTTVTGPDTMWRARVLSEIDTPNLWLSLEPLLAPVDLDDLARPLAVRWIATGGESGANARATGRHTFRSVRGQATAAGISFFFKSWGQWMPYNTDAGDGFCKTPSRQVGRILDSRQWDEVPFPR